MTPIRYSRAEGLRLLGHPAHPALVHVPLGLWLTSAAWDTLAVWRGGHLPWQISFDCLVAGLVMAAPAAVAGLADLLALAGGREGGEREAAMDTGVLHLMVMLGAASCFGGSVLARGGAAPPVGDRALWALVLSGAGVALLLWGGWLGGELVYRHGAGGRTPPGPPAGEVP